MAPTNIQPNSSISKQSGRLTIIQAKESGYEEIYVLNTSNLGGRRRPGVINIAVHTERDEHINVSIPITWIPINVTEQVAKKDIIDNPSFRKMVNQGMLTLVTKEWAEKNMEDTTNIAELDRIRMELNNVNQYDPMENNPAFDDGEAGNVTDGANAVSINPTVMDAMSRDDMTDVDRYSMIRRYESSLTATDLQFVLSNSKDNKLSQYASDRLRALKSN